MIRYASLLTVVACANPPARSDTVATDAEEHPATDGRTVDTGAPWGGRSSCDVDAVSVSCPSRTAVVDGIAGAERHVHYLLPTGEPPADGWPVVVAFQGSFSPSESFFDARDSDPFGGLHQAQVVHALLDQGYAVVAPEAHLGGSLYWDTNIPPWNVAWEGSPDDVFMENLFDALDGGEFGTLDTDRSFAMGISSGGYMTSRMAIAYPGRFRGLAIMAASYATCGGPVCFVPELPPDHPPTLFLHGTLDVVVPIATMRPYRSDLDTLGVPTREVVESGAGHWWIEAAVDEIPGWFGTVD